MKDKEIGKLIEELRSQAKYDEAYIGYFQYGDGFDESFIRANRQGLELYAAEILQAVLETEKEFDKETKFKIFGLNPKILDEESDFFFDYIELVKEKRNEIKLNYQYKETWKDKMAKYASFGILIGLGLLVIIGLVTVVSWI